MSIDDVHFIKNEQIILRIIFIYKLVQSFENSKNCKKILLYLK